jgi:hypothetical protein
MATQIVSTMAPITDTLAHFQAWAEPISSFMATAGWVQTNDTGQVVWTATVLTLTQAAVSGGNAVYSFSSYTGPAPRIGMSVIVTGFTNGGNNLTATITALTGTTSGTFTVVNGSAVNETHAGSATTTAQAAIPTSGNTVYEVWTSADSASSTNPIYLKLEYGQGGTANTASFAATVATGTNGAGTLTGNVSTRIIHTVVSSSSTTSQSVFAGSTGRLSFMCFYNAGTTAWSFFIGIERSHDSSGNDTDNYFTLLANFSISGNRNVSQQTVFKPANGGVLTAETEFVSALTTVSSGVVGTTVAMGPTFPCVGKLDNPIMACAFAKGGDIVEGATVSISYYGGSHTYYCTKASAAWTGLPRNSGTANGFLMRYE